MYANGCLVVQVLEFHLPHNLMFTSKYEDIFGLPSARLLALVDQASLEHSAPDQLDHYEHYFSHLGQGFFSKIHINEFNLYNLLLFY